jgi:hypothetical protein
MEDLPTWRAMSGGQLVVGSDWGITAAVGAVATVRAAGSLRQHAGQEDVPSAMIEKMLSDNPRTLYGLPG